MKLLFLTGMITLTLPFYAQNIIKYKIKCDRAYKCFVKKDYQGYLKEINKIERQYPLKGEELFHKGISLAQLNRKDEAAETIRLSWQITNIDRSFRLYDYYKTDSLLGFTDKQNKRIFEGEETYDWNRGLKFSDSLKLLLNNLMERDQNDRERFFSTSDSLTRIKLVILMNYNDSLSQIHLNEIISKFGFPGDSICHNHQAIGELLLFHAINLTFFNRNQKRLLEQVNSGFISPYAYAYWYDRCMIEQNKKPLYFYFSFIKPDLRKSKLYKNRKKIGMSKYYRLMEY